MDLTDYSAYEPMNKKQLNTNDFNKQKERISPRKPVTDINFQRDRG